MKNFILGFLTATLICIGVFFILNNGSDSKTEPESVKYPKSEYTSKNPAPLCTLQYYTKTNKNNPAKNYVAGIRVLEAYRGVEAYEKLKKRVSKYTLTEPEPGQEFVTALVEFSVFETKNNFPVDISSLNFFIYSYEDSKATECKRELLMSENFDDDMHVGEKAEKWITYQVKKSDKDLRLSFDDYDNENEEILKNYKANPIWFALE